MSPESLSNKEYSIKSDIFSYGIVLYEIVSRKLPWEGIDLSMFFFSIFIFNFYLYFIIILKQKSCCKS